MMQNEVGVGAMRLTVTSDTTLRPCQLQSFQVRRGNKTIPSIVATQLFGHRRLNGADADGGNLLKCKSVAELLICDCIQNQFTNQFKIKRSEHLNFSLVKSFDGDIFVHVPTRKNQTDYPGLLGKGWFADTEIAQNLATREWVAVKCYNRKAEYQKIHPKLLEKEITVLKILGIYRGFAEYRGKKNVYMKLYDGQSLEQITARNLPQTISKIIACSISVIRELAKLHAMNWVHGDIHRGNIILDSLASRMHLIDFNKSTMLDENGVALMDIAGHFFNQKTNEITPEQERSYIVLNKHTDRYSLGVTLAEMILGKTPLVDRRGKMSIAMHSEFPKVYVLELENILNMLINKKCDASLEQIVLKLNCLLIKTIKK